MIALFDHWTVILKAAGPEISVQGDFFFGIINPGPSVSKSNRLHACWNILDFYMLIRGIFYIFLSNDR
jgi:hypothetical protein